MVSGKIYDPKLRREHNAAEQRGSSNKPDTKIEARIIVSILIGCIAFAAFMKG